jgi:hypothetical protein
MKTREQRKLEHLHYALTLGDSKQSAGFEDVRFLHDCLSAVNPDRVDLRTRFAGLTLSSPLFIDALTGGADDAVTTINKQLARVAARTGIAMAVGSQYGAVRDRSSQKSFCRGPGRKSRRGGLCQCQCASHAGRSTAGGTYAGGCGGRNSFKCGSGTVHAGRRPRFCRLVDQFATAAGTGYRAYHHQGNRLRHGGGSDPNNYKPRVLTV